VTSKDMLLRIASRFLQSDQPAGQRRKDKALVKPINPPRGIDRGIARDHGKPMSEVTDDTVTPDKRDLRPEDLFIPKPNQIGVLNLVETGRDLSRAIEKQIPKDKGYDVVRNLSQYLIETKGGGGADPAG